MKKKLLAVFLITAMVMSLVACGGGTTNTPSNGSATTTKPAASAETAKSDTGNNEATPAAEADPDNPYAGIDTSKPVEITLVELGADQPDQDRVIEEINKIMKEKINTTIKLELIPLSEFATRYPTMLAAGEGVDLIYAAALVNFKDNVARKAFVELTDDFLHTYMPQTMANMPAEAFLQVAIDGKIYAIPRNEASYSSFYNVAVIRKDLREKYGLPELKSFEDYENYLFTIAENETGIYGYYNMPTHRPALYAFYEVANNFEQILKGDWFIWKDDGSFSTDEVNYYYDIPEYKEYALRMAEWAKKGVWPSDAIAGTIQPSEYFTQGRAASVIVSAGGIDSTINDCAKNGITEVEAFDIFPDRTARKSEYNGDAIAIPYSSKNPERAAMALDMLKFDPEIHLLMMGGIEGEHYILNADGTRENGPKAADYGWGSFNWAIRDDNDPKIAQSQVTLDILGSFENRTLNDSYWPCFGFSFDNSAVKTQLTLIDSITSEYTNSFDLGVFGDETEAKYDEFINRLKEAGLDQVKEEYMKQLKAYVGE